MQGSTGSVASIVDSAAMGSLLGLLPRNISKRLYWTTRDELRLAIVIWIELLCHRQRIEATQGRQAPLELELIHNASRVA